MATEPASKITKPKKEDDDIKKGFSLSSPSKCIELQMTTFDEERMNKPEIKFLCCFEDRFDEFCIQLPETFFDFSSALANHRHGYWSRFLNSIWDDSKFLIQYYDETIHNCVNLNEKNWLEYRKYVFSRLGSNIRSSVFSSRPIFRLMITKVRDSDLVSGEKFYDDYSWNRRYRETQLSPWHTDMDEEWRSLTLLMDTKVEEKNPSAQRWISGTNVDRPYKGDNTSSDRIKYVTARTRRLKEAQTPSMQHFQLGSLKKQPNFIQVEYSFIYLLTDANALYELKRHVVYKPRIFIKPYECLSEVVKAVDQRLIIIVSQSLSKHFVPLIHDLIQVIYIYILHNYDSYHEDEDDNYANDKRYRKVRGSSIEATMLISKLNDDLNQLSNIPLRELDFTDLERLNTNIDFYVVSKQPSSLKSLTGEEQNSVSFQLIIKAILESDSANPLNNLNTLTELCKLYPKQNEEKVISETNYEFRQNYVSEKAVNLYLSNTSLKNELNNCLSSKNIREICKLWFFIHDLLKQLPGGKKPIMVYRGQYLIDRQLQILKNNVGNFMTFTKFVSMSTFTIRAIRRSRGNHSHPSLKSVVFQFEISNDNTSTRFSMIHQSYEEPIFLFAAGSVFCIESVEKLYDEVWCCKLSINSDDESKVARMFQHFEMEIGTSLTYLSLGVYLNEIGNKDIADQYYETLLAIATDDDTISSINNNLAIIRQRQNNLISARKFSDEASKTGKVNTLKASTSIFEQKTDVVMADIVLDTSPIINYYNLACIYHQANRFNEALEECAKALGLSTTAPDSVNIALVHSAKGSVYFSQKNYEAALESFQMALDIALIHLPSTDPLIDQYLNNVRLLKNIIKEKQS